MNCEVGFFETDLSLNWLHSVKLVESLPAEVGMAILYVAALLRKRYNTFESTTASSPFDTSKAQAGTALANQ
jgi:hypothetical protein